MFWWHGNSGHGPVERRSLAKHGLRTRISITLIYNAERGDNNDIWPIKGEEMYNENL